MTRFLSVVFSLFFFSVAHSGPVDRREFLLHFKTTAVAPNENVGTASTVELVTYWPAKKEKESFLCSQWNQADNSSMAVFRTTTNSSGNLFFARGNITFGSAGMIFIEASNNGVAFSEANLSYGAIPYLITGGTNSFKGAVGSAADIFLSSDPSSPNFDVFVFGVFYLPTSAPPSMPVSSFSSKRSKTVSEQSCSVGLPGGYQMTPFFITFHSQPASPNFNYAYGFAGSITTFADFAHSTELLSTPLSPPLLYTSSTGSSSPSNFNESGRISLQSSNSDGFDFSSTTDGTVVSLADVVMGSIAYKIGNGQGVFSNVFGSMVDVFESDPQITETSVFPIRTFGILLSKSSKN